MIIEKLGITPGPWEHNDFHECTHAIDDSGKVLKVVCVDEYNNDNLADYTLIAAAPEMLEALVKVKSALDECGMFMDMVDDTIIKATGKTWEEIRKLI